MHLLTAFKIASYATMDDLIPDFEMILVASRFFAISFSFFTERYASAASCNAFGEEHEVGLEALVSISMALATPQAPVHK